MDREEYRRAFDSIPFDAGFRQRAKAALRQEAGRTEREYRIMPLKKFGKTAALLAAALAVLTLSVSAYLLLSPAQVARELDDPVLAEAFASEDAVLLDQSARVGDYDATLLGLVSGKGLSAFGSDFEQEHTYIVLSLASADGTPLEQTSYDAFSTTITPLVAGCPVHAVNCWTLGGFARCAVRDGTAYYLLDVQSIEMFADRTVYLAVYPGGGVPSTDQFDMAADGSLSYAAGHEGALFVLPLDASRADPEAAEAFVRDTGLVLDKEEGEEPSVSAPSNMAPPSLRAEET